MAGMVGEIDPPALLGRDALPPATHGGDEPGEDENARSDDAPRQATHEPNPFPLTAAKAAPGVVAIFTGADLAEAKVGGLPCGWLIHSKDGSPMKEPPHPVLAQGKVRHVGDQVALVVAETLLQAKDAAELIEVDYDELPAVVDTATASAAAANVHDDAPGNQCYLWQIGDGEGADAAIKGAAHVTKLHFRNNRLIPNAMEPRAANAHYTKHDDSYTLYVANQNPHVERLLMSAFVLGLPESKVRVIAPDVGGGFGSKIFLYAEETALVWASKRVGRPIKWTAERSEAFLTDAHGRDHHTKVELAMDAKGNFLALRVNTIANMGAYLSTFASSVPTILYATLLAGQAGRAIALRQSRDEAIRARRLLSANRSTMPCQRYLCGIAQQLALEHSGQPCGGEDIAQGRMQRLRSLQDLLWQVCLPTVLHHALEVRLHRLRGCV